MLLDSHLPQHVAIIPPDCPTPDMNDVCNGNFFVQIKKSLWGKLKSLQSDSERGQGNFNAQAPG